MPLDDPDELWPMRNQYYVGNYEGVLSEAESARVDESDKVLSAEKELFTQLANLAKGEPVTTQYKTLEFKALALLNSLFQEEEDEEKIEKLLVMAKRLVDEDGTGNQRLRMIVGIAFARFGSDHNEALRILHSAGNSLETLHVTCSLLISLDRVDLAKKTLEQMQNIDEDSTLTQLSSAWVGIAMGTEKGLKDASYILQELIGKWQATPLLVGALSCVYICQGKYSEAEKVISSCAGDTTAELLVNQIVTAQHEGRRLDEYIGGLKSIAPGHAWFQEMATQSAAFDRAAEGFKI